MRHWLAATLFSIENMQEVTDLLGRHYETVSALHRLLDAKIEKRVFWPGYQFVFYGDITMKGITKCNVIIFVLVLTLQFWPMINCSSLENTQFMGNRTVQEGNRC